MRKNKTNPYEKIIKQFLILLALLFFSPFFFNIALKAEQLYTNGNLYYLAYGLLILASFLLIFTVYFGFKTFQNLLKIIFEDE